MPSALCGTISVCRREGARVPLPAPHSAVPSRTTLCPAAPSHTSLPCPEPYHADPPRPCSTPHCFTPVHVVLPHPVHPTTPTAPHCTIPFRISPHPGPVPPRAASPCTVFPPAPDITMSPKSPLGRGARPDGEQHSRQGQRPASWPDLPAPSAARCSPAVSPALPASV